MKTEHYTPEQASINLDIEKIENEFFSGERRAEVRRGKAFQYLCHSITCDIDENDIEVEDIIDGEDEEGIDIISSEENNNEVTVNILNCKSSQSNNFSANDLTQLRTGLQYIFEEPNSVIIKITNIRLKAKIDFIRANQDRIRKIYVFYCVFNGDRVEKNVARKRDEILDRYTKLLKSQYPNATFRFQMLSCKDLYQIKLRNSESMRDVEAKIPYYDSDRLARPEITSAEGIRGFITTIKAEEIAKLVNQYGDKLFEKNIRGWLKYIKKNLEIYETCISAERGLFWFLNNGITIIGDKVLSNDSSATWRIFNLQIVNGQQTARMIYEAWKEKNLKKDVTVMCRIYEANEIDFITRITKATNSQSSIGSRDLMSNDPRQIALQKYFEKIGYFYERQRGEKKSGEDFKDTFSSKKLAQVSLGILCKRPSLARKNIEDNFFNPHKHYNQIFDRNPEELLVAYLLYKYCDDLRDENNEISYFGILHIARIIWEYLSAVLNKDWKQTIQDFEDGQIKIKREYNRVVNHLNELIKDRVKESSMGNFLSRIEVDELLFRSFSSSKMT